MFAALACAAPALAADLPSFLHPGDAFCTAEADFDELVRQGSIRSSSASCRLVQVPTRVAVIGGVGGVKSVVRVTAGPDAYLVGWTNGALPP